MMEKPDYWHENQAEAAMAERPLNKPEQLAQAIDSMDEIHAAITHLMAELVGNSGLISTGQPAEVPPPVTLCSVLDQGPAQLFDTKERCMKAVSELRVVLL